MTARQRTDQLYKGLTAGERIRLLLHWFREGEDTPAAFARAIPDWEVSRINAIMRFVETTNHEVVWMLLWIGSRLEAIEARLGVVASLRLCGLFADQILTHLVCDAGEPISQTRFQAQLKAARAESFPVADFAERLAEADLDNEDLDDDEYDRRVLDHTKNLTRLVAEGRLPGKGRGRSLRIPAGAFHDWQGSPPLVLPEWGLGFEVLPDDAADQIDRLQRQREAIHSVARRMLKLTASKTVEGDAETEPDLQSIRRSLADELAARWTEVLAVEQVLAFAGQQLVAEPPVRPETQELLEGTKLHALELAEQLRRDAEEFVLPGEPAADLVQFLHRQIQIIAAAG